MRETRTVPIAGLLLLALTSLCCESPPTGRAVHTRLADVLYSSTARVPLSTASYPREIIGQDTRTVLRNALAVARGGQTFEHARVELAVPEDAALQVAYGLRAQVRNAALPTAAAATFRITLRNGREERVVWEDTLRAGESGATGWKESFTALPAADSATLIFSTSTPPVKPAAVGLFATPVLTAPTVQRRPNNVILVSLDTLRADHLGIYGYHRPTSPHMDRIFGSDGIVVEHVYSQGTDTWSGHIAMLDGMLPTTASRPVLRGPYEFYEQSPAIVSLAERLRAHGYRTAAFTEDALLDGSAGFNRGFEVYFEETTTEPGVVRGHIEHTFDRGLSWLRRYRDQPVFLFLHTYQVHDPYTPPARFQNLFPTPDDAPESQRDLDNYDREIVYTDEQVARLIAALDEMGLRDDTILIVTSDHGEEFGEHGRRHHGANTTDEVLRVPLMIRAPGLLLPGERRPGPMALMDLVPTLLDLLGYEVPPSLQGRSLAAHLRHGRPVDPLPIMHEARAQYALTYDGFDPSWIKPSFAATLWPLRLTRVRTSDGFRYTLYDLAADPGETNNLYEERADRVGDLEVLLDTYEQTALAAQQNLERRLASAQPEPTVEMDPARYEKLRALGYIR